MIDDARLTAYLDGALDAQSHAEVDAALLADSLVAARLSRLRAQRFKLLQDEAQPERLVASGGGGRDNIVRLADRRAAPPPPRRQWTLKWPAWGGVAVSLLVGAGLGYAAARETGGPLVARRDGSLVARGDLVRVLNNGVSGQPGLIRIGVSFKSADRRYCRTFQMDVQQLAGVACREGAVWVARMTAISPAVMRTASEPGKTPLSVVEAVDDLMVGHWLAPGDEAQASARGWKD